LRPGALDDVEATCERLAADGVTFHKELASLPWGRFASFRDTEGNEFGMAGLNAG
jgi:lactoylglutathione lyase